MRTENPIAAKFAALRLEGRLIPISIGKIPGGQIFFTKPFNGKSYKFKSSGWDNSEEGKREWDWCCNNQKLIIIDQFGRETVVDWNDEENYLVEEWG